MSVATVKSAHQSSMSPRKEIRSNAEKLVEPLRLVPFLPQDNSSKDENQHDRLQRAVRELGRCLALPFPAFLHCVLHDAALAKFVDTFLRFRRRHYETPDTSAVSALPALPTEEPDCLPELGRRVFLVLFRAVGPEHASLPPGEEETSPPEEGKTHGEVLVGNSGMLRPSAVLDLCALYGRSNPDLVAGLLRSLSGLEGGRLGVILAEGLGKAGTLAARALGDVHAKVAGAQVGVGGAPIPQSEASDLLSFVTDAAVSVGSLLRTCIDSDAEGSNTDSRSTNITSTGDGSSLTQPPSAETEAASFGLAVALRLQGSDGNIAPEGLAAALALTFEGTLPALEDILLAEKLSSPLEHDVIRARIRVARQWLLRCLHFLIGPIFLQPLGLQQASSSARASVLSRDGGGAGERDARAEGGQRKRKVGDVLAEKTKTGLADGLFEFLTSLTAASGHLAPPGHTGSLLGEYNRRFRLADVLDQSQALLNTTTTASATTNPQPSFLSSSPLSPLGDERTEYLAGVLRGLPVVSEEGMVSSEKEALARAAASRQALSAALENDQDGGSRFGFGARVRGQEAGGRQNGSVPDDPEVVDDMVKSVQAVFGGPDEKGGVGEGFVEACLSVLGWSPQAVIGAILEDRLPPQVAGLDRGLRRAWKGKKGDLDKAYRVDKDLAAAEAKRLIAMEKQQENDAYLLSREYDDDYDDQYDGRGVDVGGGGMELGDMETIRRVNQLVRQEEDEDRWWEENKNDNLSFAAPGGRGRRHAHPEVDDADAEDGDETVKDNSSNNSNNQQGGFAARGGRGSRGRGGSQGGRGGGRGGGKGQGRGRGARGAEGGQDGGGRGEGGARGSGGRGGSGTTADRIQQRRKGQNKAAVGNHNRKNAARKKESKGMF